MKRDLPKNDVPLLILSVLATGSFHGYAIAREVERRSAETLKLREGTLYPALRALELDGRITGKWEIQPSGPAKKVYSLTEAGRKELARREAEWRQYARMIEAIMGGERNEPAEGAVCDFDAPTGASGDVVYNFLARRLSDA
ncbi:MAG: helix-turn-helix transcriptional regulator [Capsulimonadales bacterium]|nr:helix-turn-helix transcriptional regulator [Capsulimonadales bacterium]